MVSTANIYRAKSGVENIEGDRSSTSGIDSATGCEETGVRCKLCIQIQMSGIVPRLAIKSVSEASPSNCTVSALKAVRLDVPGGLCSGVSVSPCDVEVFFFSCSLSTGLAHKST